MFCSKRILWVACHAAPMQYLLIVLYMLSVILSATSLLNHGANLTVLLVCSTEGSMTVFSPSLLHPFLFVKPAHRPSPFVGPLSATLGAFLSCLPVTVIVFDRQMSATCRASSLS